jgi:hypothetical protein
MAENQGSGSPFCKQLPRTSSKLSTYEALFLLNQRVDQVVVVLRKMEQLPTADKQSIDCAITEIEEVRSGMNATFTEKLANHERFEEGRFWKRRTKLEKKWRDPDDVYIDVQRREEERKKRGLAARIIVLPWSPADEDKLVAANRVRERNKRKRASSQRTTPQRRKK